MVGFLQQGELRYYRFMRKLIIVSAFAVFLSTSLFSQEPGTGTTVLSLEDALKIALSENVSVKVADREITRSEYARRGTYASLFPQIDASGAFQRTIKKQVMYMDGGGFNMGSMIAESLLPFLMPLYAQHPGLPFPQPSQGGEEEGSESSSGGNEGISVGRTNTWSAGVSASMPIINFQLWENVKLAGQNVELAVEQARSSRLDMVSQVKQAFYGVLLAKQVRDVYNQVYENAADNFRVVEMRYNAQKASELEYTRSKATLEGTLPNLFNSEASVDIALWSLKAVMGLDLDEDIDVAGALDDYEQEMFPSSDAMEYSLENNTTVRQLALQAEQLASAVRLQQAAYLPSLSLAFTYNMSAMANDFQFSEYRWSPYSYLGLSLQIPIFSGGRRLNQVKQARVQLDELQIQRQDTERRLRIALRQTLATMETGVKNYYAAKVACETAAKAYGIARKSFEVGRSTQTDLNDAQLALTQSQLNISQCIYNVLVAKTGLEQMIGEDFINE